LDLGRFLSSCQPSSYLLFSQSGIGNPLNSYAFCGECGTHIFYRLLPTNEYFVPAGLFQNGIEFEFKEQIFIDMKPSYYEFANHTLNMTEAEVFAKFVPSENISGT